MNVNPKSTKNLSAATEALAYVPVIFGQLDNDARDMLVKVLQATIEAGYENGYADGRRSAERDEK